jgi:glycosyltransferase involved in cell wall biosynthesis
MHEECYNKMGNVIINCTLNNYKYDPLNYLNFREYITTKNVKFSWGLESLMPEYIKNLVNIVVYFEEPNYLHKNQIDCCCDNYDIKLTLCKFTSEEFNKKYINKKCYNVFFPIDTLYLKNNLWDKYNYNFGDCVPYWKNINVIYTGHDLSILVDEFKKTMNKYNNNHTLNIPDYLSKMDSYLHSKIAIVHNLLFFNDSNNDMFKNIKSKLPIFKDEVTTSTEKYIPQLKSRLFEAASSQCIILCYRDNYNLIEDYFKEDEDFIYFDSSEHLDKLIKIILDDYEKYSYIALNAYKKFMNNYTLKHFCDKYINIY